MIFSFFTSLELYLLLTSVESNNEIQECTRSEILTGLSKVIRFFSWLDPMRQVGNLDTQVLPVPSDAPMPPLEIDSETVDNNHATKNWTSTIIFGAAVIVGFCIVSLIGARA